MICASCGAALESKQERCVLCEGAALLGGRYRLESEVRRGGAGVLYAATDEQSGDVVAVKEILLRDLDAPADAARPPGRLAEIPRPGALRSRRRLRFARRARSWRPRTRRFRAGGTR